MADHFTRPAFQALRTALAQLTALSYTPTPAADALRLRAVGAAAEALRQLLLDPTLAALLTASAAAPVEPAPPAADDSQSAVLLSQSSADPDWDTLAPGSQTAAQRHDIFALLFRLDWPLPRITNVLAKHARITAPTAQAAVDAIATLDGRTTHALLEYLARHWTNAQEAPP